MQPGQTIAGKYRLNRVIGAGGMASVWSATNIFTEREFAIKVMLPQVRRTPEAQRRFMLEARVSARINHPNIIEVIDVGQAEDGSLFLVMELLTGVSLETAMRRTTPPMLVHDLIVYMHDVARALAAAHKSGVVHRDLKPTNIYLHKDRDGGVVAKILDFGVSKILESDAHRNDLTIAGTVLGSPLYMSPEQAMGQTTIDGRTDIFAFGGILFEALTGTRAYDGPNFNALIVAIATQQPKNIDTVGAHLPAPLRAIIRDCLQTDRDKRVASFELLLPRLASAIEDLKTSNLRIPSSATTSPPSDPDRTAAMPVVRESQRPASRAAPRDALKVEPPGAPASSGSALQDTQPAMAREGVGLVANPPGVSAPWATPSPTGNAPPAQGPWTVPLLIAGTIVAAIVVLVVALRVAQSTPPHATANSGWPPASASAPPPGSSNVAARASASGEPPVVSIDALPVAGKHNGKLTILATGGSCAVSVDGMPQGPTPQPALEVPAGTHRVDCVTSNGKTKSASVTVYEGKTERYKFAVDE